MSIPCVVKGGVGTYGSYTPRRNKFPDATITYSSSCHSVCHLLLTKRPWQNVTAGMRFGHEWSRCDIWKVWTLLGIWNAFERDVRWTRLLRKELFCYPRAASRVPIFTSSPVITSSFADQPQPTSLFISPARAPHQQMSLTSARLGLDEFRLRQNIVVCYRPESKEDSWTI